MEDNEYETSRRHNGAFKYQFNALTAMSELIDILKRRGRHEEARDIENKHYQLYKELR
jgi:hypothetical protein